LCYISRVPTEARIKRVHQVLSLRQPDLRVVFEELTNPHNASAVLRTCDAAGVLHVHFVSAGGDDFPINKAISTRADKWVELHRHETIGDCVSTLKKKNFQIAATCLREDAIPYDAVNYTKPTAIIFGNESEGITSEALDLADLTIKIPMLGMVQSLNLSVSVGIILYEALRQRQALGFFKRPRLSSEDCAAFAKKWLSAEHD
jgi:tRNA (guanosine-2'-O-)-methyltransferase